METVIGCAHADGAKTLFSAPAIDGDVFRDVVDIYACGTGPYLAELATGYVRKLAESKEKDLYFVWARSFMAGGGGRCGGPFPDEPPVEQFDVAFCIPVEALTDDAIENIDEMFRFGGGGRCGGPFPRGGGHPGPKGHGPKSRGRGKK